MKPLLPLFLSLAVVQFAWADPAPLPESGFTVMYEHPILQDSPDLARSFQKPTAVAFRDLSTGEILPYTGKDVDGATEMGTFFYRPVLSPDHHWTFLPWGRFTGFIYFPTAELSETKLQGQGVTRVFVKFKDGPAAVHEFVEWRGLHQVKLRFSANGESQEVVIDLKKQTVQPKKGIFAEAITFEEMK